MAKISINMADALKRVGQSIMDSILASAKVLVSKAEPIVESMRTPWPAQELLIRGTVAALQRGKLNKSETSAWITSPKALRADRPRAAIINAEMGTGKTLMGALAAYIIAEKSVRTNILIVCPPNLRFKWEEEIVMTIPDAVVIQCENEKAKGKNALHTLRLGLEARRPGLTFFVIADTAMRRHHSQIPILLERNPVLAKKLDLLLFAKTKEAGLICENTPDDAGEIARCPECGQATFLREKKIGENSGKTGSKKFFTRKQVIGNLNDDKLVCPGCHAILTTTLRSNVTVEIDDSSEESFEKTTPHAMAREVSPAYWAKKKARRQGLIDLVIIDEAHRGKGNGIQAETMTWISNAAKKVLLLTGTLTGGYARDLFKMCQQVNPLALRRAGFAGRKDAFAVAYGATEVKTIFGAPAGAPPPTTGGTAITTAAMKKAAAAAKLRVKSRSFRALPGISANVYPEFLMDRTLFLALKDLDIEMPKLTESLELIDMDENMATAYNQLRHNFKRFVADQIAISKALAAKGGKDFKNQIAQLISISLQVFLSWPDRLQADAVSGKVGDNEVHLPIFDYLPETPTPKEARIMEIIRENKEEGRKVLVFVSFTGDRDCAKRMESTFRANGINAAILRGKVAPNKRMDWIRTAVAKGYDCVISNPELVKEGLDLFEFPTIVVAQPMPNLYTHRQAMARAYRPGQTQDVRHYFLGYTETSQEHIMALVASKLDSALLAEGNMSDSAMLEISTSADSVLRELIQAIIDDSEGLIKARPTAKFAAFPLAPSAQIETAKVVMMLDESGIPFPVKVITRTSVGLPPRRKRSPRGLYHPNQMMLFDFVVTETEPAPEPVEPVAEDTEQQLLLLAA